jgi:NAD(P)-dependent dehydrogenase (short-subunit alcohol dehydrogenase family)
MLTFRQKLKGRIVLGLLAGKSIVVTGAGRGIGRAVALECARAGANVVVADLGVGMAGEDPTSDVADAVVNEIGEAGGSALAFAHDIATMQGGGGVVQAAVDAWGQIDGVVTCHGILRERMLFNMSEDEWDDVVRVHLKGTFTIFRAASAIMRKQGSGSLVAFTSGAFQGSVAQANYSAAKGGIVSLVRSAALGLYRYGVRANAVAPVARTRMSENVPAGLVEIGEAEDVAPMCAYLLSDRAADVTGQIYTAVGSRIAVWNQPQELRSMTTDGRWTPEEIADRLDEIGQEEMPLMGPLKEALSKAAQEAKA